MNFTMKSVKHENISKTIDEIYDYQIVSDFFYNMLIDLEGRSRTNNLIVYGLFKAKGKLWKKCEEKVERIFHEKLGLVSILVERVNLVKRNKNDRRTKPWTMVSNLLSFKENKLVLGLQRNSKIKNKHVHSWKFLARSKNFRSEGKIAYLNYCSIINKGKKRGIASE